MNNTETITLNPDELKLFASSILKKSGCPDNDAKLASDVLIAADLRGIDSHGVARLSGYVRLIEAGRVNTKPNLRILRKKHSVFTVDGDAGLGLVIAPAVMDMVLEHTSKHGSSFAAVSNSNHFGIAAYHAMKALQHSFIGMAMTNASPLVAPLNSKERMLGTNPICYAIPAGKEEPFVLDMATSAAANGKLEIAERKQVQVPEGWLQTRDGLNTNDPGGLKNGGYLLPLGSDADHGSHKGYGLGALVDILSGVLSGAAFGPWVPPFVSFLPVLPDLPGKGLGHFLGAMDVDGFMEKEEFKSRMDLWIRRFKSAEPIDPNKPVLIPGHPEMSLHNERQNHGIPLQLKVADDLKQLAEKLNIDHPFKQ